MNLAKATSAGTSTSSIVVSFDQKWHRLLVDGKIRAIVRKRGPTKIRPEWIYVYVNQPISALVAKIPVRQFQWRQGFDSHLCEEAALRPNEMKFYIGDERYAAYHVGAPILARPQISLRELNSKLGFTPPQSFFVISVSGKEQLDNLGNF